MVTASLVLGEDGSTTLAGTSRGISTPEDREVFLSRRRDADCIIVGGRTATFEPYTKTPVPLIIVSRSRPLAIDINAQAHWWNVSPVEAVTKARKEFGKNIAIEGGANFIHNLLAAGCIDELRLSITPITGGEDKIMIHELTKFFAKISEEEKMGVTHFFTCTKPITNPK